MLEVHLSPAFVIAISAVAVSGCASPPAPTTHDQWLSAQFELSREIRDCDPRNAICHSMRARQSFRRGCHPPEFPYVALTDDAEGVAEVRLNVAVNGVVTSVELTKSAGHPSLDRVATMAFSQCQFPPNLKAQTPEGSAIYIRYRFRITDDGKPGGLQILNPPHESVLPVRQPLIR
jgi:TonB family protein